MSRARRSPTTNEMALLLSEVDNLCPLCTKKLMYEKNGKRVKQFEAAHIYPLNPTLQEVQLLENEGKLDEDVNDLSNFIALCRNCHKKFDHPRTVEEYRMLFKLKKKLIAISRAREKYHDYQIESDIRQVIYILSTEFTESNLVPLSMKALKVEQKADKTLNPLSKRRIINDATDYYEYIKGQFQLLDQQGKTSFELIATQVKAVYLKMKSTESSQQIIYEQLIEWLYKKTQNISKEACSILIAFFIQNCEVF